MVEFIFAFFRWLVLWSGPAYRTISLSDSPPIHFISAQIEGVVTFFSFVFNFVCGCIQDRSRILYGLFEITPLAMRIIIFLDIF